MSFMIDVPEGFWTCYNWNLWKGVAWMLNYLVLQKMNQIEFFLIKIHHSWAITSPFTIIEVLYFAQTAYAVLWSEIEPREKKLYTSAEVVCYVKPQFALYFCPKWYTSTLPYDILSFLCFTAYAGYPYCYNSRALSRFSYASDRRWGRYCIVHWRFQIWHRYDSSYISTAWLSRKCQTYRCSTLWYHLPQSQSTSDTFQVSGCDACAVSFD